MKNNTFIVGIGSSAGGQDALQKFFSYLDTSLNAAYVVITHLLRTHESRLDQIISRFTDMEVKRVTKVTHVMSGCVYILPENMNLTIKNGFLYPKIRHEESVINKAIDIFFESLAIDQKQKAIGVILSGMGTDGSNGALKMFENGGTVLVQEPSTARFNSMPWSAIMKDHPDYILPPEKIALKLAQLLNEKLVKSIR